jgi:hypothetical protein
MLMGDIRGRVPGMWHIRSIYNRDDMNSKKRKQECVETKFKVIEEVASGCKNSEVARKYGVTSSTLAT